MPTFVTGATGFIGRHLMDLLLRREGRIHALVREGSQQRLDELRKSWGPGGERVIPVVGDLTAPRLGVSDEQLGELQGADVFHVAALYDMAADAESLGRANLDGTTHALELARAIEARIFHHVSSIAVAGSYPGIFREDMFEEAEGLEDPYFRSKHESEGLVRNGYERPYRIYRPGVVVGHSQTGEMDKIDGPYYLFKTIQKLRNALPPWLPLIGIEGGPAHIVPVDFVARAIDHIAHAEGLDGKTFHLVDPDHVTMGQSLNAFARAAHAPEFALRLEANVSNAIPKGLRNAVADLPPVRKIVDQTLEDMGIPSRVLTAANLPRLDCRETTAALEGSGIEVPRLADYAPRLWDYWERNMDPDLFRERSLGAAVSGKRVLVTGASAGIGRAVALAVGAAGATVLLVARSPEKLADVKLEVEKAGGSAFIHTADLSDLESCASLVEEVIAQHGGVDVLVNNAGRSIRRSVNLSFERFHDFERTMQLNYFGALKLILGFLPAMQKSRGGQIINISSMGVQTHPPRFAAYVASKAALDAFSRCAAPEFLDEGIAFTTVCMPLVRTEMIAPTKIYQRFPTISADEAAQLITDAMIDRPKRVSTKMGAWSQMIYAIAPKATDVIAGMAWKLLPDSSAAKGEKSKPGEEEPSTEAVAFAHLLPGTHW
ncbi:MAG: short chain dehydrogenase [Deltaproteobacteria bacterium]|nr:short chain dehydrogenase [Deltaproteobacteria bacterium]